jgi:hypothetical protein
MIGSGANPSFENPQAVKPVNAVRGSHYCDTVGAKGDFQIQLSCPLAEQALAAAVAAGHRVVALGREKFAAHRTVDLFMPNTRAGTGVEHASAAIVAAHTLGTIPGGVDPPGDLHRPGLEPGPFVRMIVRIISSPQRDILPLQSISPD